MQLRSMEAGFSTRRVTLVHLVRHGRAGDGRWPLPSDAPLTPEGQEEAQAAATLLARYQGKAARICASDLPRCRETAEAIAGRLGGELVLEPGLREMEFGWEGESEQEVLRRIPAERLAAFLRDPASVDLPRAEPFRDFWQRVQDSLQGCLAGAAGRPLVLVGHDGVNRVIELIAAGLGPADWSRAHPFRHGEVRRVAVRRGP